VFCIVNIIIGRKIFVIMTRKLYFIIVVLCINFGSCDYYRVVTVEFINHSSLPVELSYSKLKMIDHDSLLYDTVYHELAVGTSLKKDFFVWWGGKRTLCKEISFFEFETPEKSVRFEGPDGVVKVFSKRARTKHEYDFVITDSLLNCKK